MSSFKDTHGYEWTLDIKFHHIELVKRLCKDKTGKPVDLLKIAELGEIEQLENDIELVFNIVFALCYEQVMEHFDLAVYDSENESMYDVVPELKSEKPMVKASRWFGNRMNGGTLTEVKDAFIEALIDFFPNQSRKAALKKIVEKQKELDQIGYETTIEQINESFGQITETVKQKARQIVTDGLSGNVRGLSG